VIKFIHIVIWWTNNFDSKNRNKDSYFTYIQLELKNKHFMLGYILKAFPLYVGYVA
jgi:hypothetical protein